MFDWPFFPLMTDAATAILLGVAIIYLVQVNRRLVLLREDRDRLGETVANLYQATRQAEAAVTQLKVAASEGGQANGLRLHVDARRCDGAQCAGAD